MPLENDIDSVGRHVHTNLPLTAAPLCVAAPRCPPDQLPRSHPEGSDQTSDSFDEAAPPLVDESDSANDMPNIAAPPGLTRAFPTNSAERKRDAKRDHAQGKESAHRRTL